MSDGKSKGINENGFSCCLSGAQAEAVLELHEVRQPMGRRELRFEMLEGDFEVSQCHCQFFDLDHVLTMIFQSSVLQF